MQRLKEGFTLAEVLITLTLIGVVAALTLPAIITNVQNRGFEVGIRKAYNSLSNAIELYMADEEVSQLSQSSLAKNQEGLKSFVKKYFMVTKDCNRRYYNPNGNSCFAKEIYSLKKTSTSNLTGHMCMVTVLTGDGMALCFDSGPLTNTTDDLNGDGVVDDKDTPGTWRDDYPAVMTMEVDLNGPKGPNVVGRDIFAMDVLDNGIITDTSYDESKRAEILKKFQDNAWPMPIGIIQSDGWKMTY